MELITIFMGHHVQSRMVAAHTQCCCVLLAHCVTSCPGLPGFLTETSTMM